MKIAVLMENTSLSDSFKAEHGLSLYIETNHKRILFDAGQSSAFADNAEQLGIDLRQIDFAILSHGHYDHSGGLTRFLQINQTAPVYLSKYAFSACYHGSDRYIGIDPSLQECDRLIFTDNEHPISEGITLFSCNEKEKSCPIDSSNLTILKHNKYCQDLFLHEQYLLIEEENRRVLISGCSHKGILNIAEWFQPDILIGGFHFMNLDPDTEDHIKLDHAAHKLLEFPTTYYTGHCTGHAQFDRMKHIMQNKLCPLSSGLCLTI